MNKMVQMVILTIVILSSISTFTVDAENDKDISIPNISGTRAGTIVNESVNFFSGECVVPGNLYYSTEGGKRPAVVFGVGYMAVTINVIGELYDPSNYGWLAMELASRGYVVLVVRYCVPSPFDNLSQFIEFVDDYTLWVNYTKSAVTALINGDINGASVSTSSIVDEKRIALGGHSIGGAISIVSGAQDRRIKCVFALAPKDLAGTPRMDDYVGLLSPVPIQLQVGELDQIVGVQEVRTSYSAASTPKQKVEYRYGTYEGFTDVGSVENINVDDIPFTIPAPLAPYLAENPLSTKQHAMSIDFTVGFLDYYLKNEETFNIKDDYSEDFLIPTFPVPTPVPDLWHASVAHNGLDDIFHEQTASPASLDFELDGDVIEISARITPRGIWETGVVAEFTYEEGVIEQHEMTTFDDAYDVSAGDFRLAQNIAISHSLGEVRVRINATDDKGNTYTSEQFSFYTTTTSDLPTIEKLEYSPDTLVPNESITITVSASDKDKISYFHIDFGDGTTTGWINSESVSESVTQSIMHTYENSGQYTIKIKAKDSKAAESEEFEDLTIVSHPPVAALKVDSTVQKGDSVEFDASGSFDEDEDDLEYLFEFGDGHDSGWVVNSIFSYTYSDTGEMKVSLKAKDNYGLESEPVSLTIQVKDEDDSLLGSFISSSSFLVLIIIIVVIIVLGGFYLFQGRQEDMPKQDPSPGAPPFTSDPLQTQEQPTGRIPPPEMVKSNETPMAQPIGRTLDKPMVSRESKEDEPLPKLEPKEQDLRVEKPEPPRPPDAITVPEIDAPPIEEESWDDASGDADIDESTWGDEDFAIPVALKEKLKKDQ